jgi:alpha-beta hydrolase superfamily lysophospholipase
VQVEGTFSGQGGIEIFWRAWVPDGALRATVVLAHGLGEQSGRYAHVGERLAASGHAVYALDHRGHGRSGGRRARIDSLDDVVADLRTFIGIAGSRHDGQKPVLLGHSMGGLVSIAFAIRHQDDIGALLLSSPLAALESASPVTRFASRVLSALAPGLGVLAVDPALVSRDPEVVMAYADDPLVFHRKIPARTIAQLVGAVEGFPAEVAAIRVPLIVMLGSADRLAAPAGGRMVHERASSADKTLEVYDGLYHEILNEPEQDKVMADIVGWLDARVDRA